MQVLDEKKRVRICAVARELFARRPFAAVRLEEVARRAGVGKGTLYTYYASKEELYLAVVTEGFAALLKRLESQLNPTDGGRAGQRIRKPKVRQGRRGKRSVRSPREDLRLLIGAMLEYAYQHPQLFTLMRNLPPPQAQSPMMQMRRSLEMLIEAVIRRGVAAGVWRDASPAWTAQYIPGMIRSVLLFSGKRPRREALAEHLMQMLTGGLEAGGGGVVRRGAIPRGT